MENDTEQIHDKTEFEFSSFFSMFDSFWKQIQIIHPLHYLTFVYVLFFFIIYAWCGKYIREWYRTNMREKILEWIVYWNIDKSGNQMKSIYTTSDDRGISKWLEYIEYTFGLDL